MLPSSTLPLLLLLASPNLLPTGCCSQVVSGLVLETASPIPQVVKIGPEEMEELWVPIPRFVELHDIMLQIVQKMLLRRGRTAEPIRGGWRIERVVKRGRETEGSWSPAGWAPSATWAPSGQTHQLKPFFMRDRVTKVGKSMNRDGLFERILKWPGNLQDESQKVRKLSNQIDLFPWSNNAWVKGILRKF